MEAIVPSIQLLGDAALVVSWGNIINRETNSLVHQLAASIHAKPFDGLIDLVPAYSSLTVLFDPLVVAMVKDETLSVQAYLSDFIGERLQHLEDISIEEKEITTIPVCFDEGLENDLAIISQHSGKSNNEIIDLFLGEIYFVYMAGFLPGFVYMGNVPESIAMPRKQKPMKVKAGAVAIAGVQTGIYPVDSPGGWHVLGYTPVTMFDASRETPSLLSPGGQVKFSTIDIKQFLEWKKE